jgi:hypothetical protein
VIISIFKWIDRRKRLNTKKAPDYPRASIMAINKKLIAGKRDDVIRHSLKTKSGYAHINAGFRYSFHQEVKNPAASCGASSKEKANMGAAAPQTPACHSSTQQAAGYSGFFP